MFKKTSGYFYGLAIAMVHPLRMSWGGGGAASGACRVLPPADQPLAAAYPRSNAF